MNWINSFLNRFTSYWLLLWLLRVLIAVTTILSLLGLLPYTWWHIPLNMVLLLVFCWAANFIFSFIFNVKPNYESQYITGEILTLIVGPADPLANWQFLLLISVIAMGSKYILAINKRHIFNPAAVSVVASALIMNQSASWWVGTVYTLPIVVLGGLLLVKKVRWFDLLFAFLITYSILLMGTQIYDGANSNQALEALRITLVNSGILFFAFIMLTEPLTAPSGKRNRIIYGVAIAVLVVGLQRFYPQIYYNLELSLVLGNVLAFLLSPNPKIKLKLKEKNYFARNCMVLSFQPDREFKFKPGQYLQFIVNHPKPDNRGTRRYFSIASSPTEKDVKLTTKFADESSTYKNKLKDLNRDEVILAGSLDGDFVLPNKLDKGLVFIAGGVGIAPFRSMIKYIIDNNLKADITLFYSNKDYDEIGFTDLFDEAEEKIGLKTVYVLTGKTPPNWSGRRGFITDKMISEEVPDHANKIYYISGPDPMVRSYVKLLKNMGISPGQIKTDYFPGYE